MVQDLLLQFAEDIRCNSQDRVIVDNDFIRKVYLYKEEISGSDFIDNIRELIKRSRGRELPGTFNPFIVGDLFYQYSKL